MTYITKPKLHHPTLEVNKVGYTRRDYEGKVSTLCAGCGHDSISAAIVQACWELDIEPHRVAKLSGIGCSSKTPDYFLGASHGFNTVHGRMNPLELLERGADAERAVDVGGGHRGADLRELFGELGKAQVAVRIDVHGKVAAIACAARGEPRRLRSSAWAWPTTARCRAFPRSGRAKRGSSRRPGSGRQRPGCGRPRRWPA